MYLCLAHLHVSASSETSRMSAQHCMWHPTPMASYSATYEITMCGQRTGDGAGGARGLRCWWGGEGIAEQVLAIMTWCHQQSRAEPQPDNVAHCMLACRHSVLHAGLAAAANCLLSARMVCAILRMCRHGPFSSRTVTPQEISIVCAQPCVGAGYAQPCLGAAYAQRG